MERCHSILYSIDLLCQTETTDTRLAVVLP